MARLVRCPRYDPHPHCFLVLTLLLTNMASPGMLRGEECIDYGAPPADPLIGQANTPDSAEDVVVFNNYAYITGGLGLYVVDLSNPAAPQIVGDSPTHSRPRALAVAWPHVYVAGSDKVPSFDVVNVMDPASPVVVGTLSLTGYVPNRAVVSGSFAPVGG